MVSLYSWFNAPAKLQYKKANYPQRPGQIQWKTSYFPKIIIDKNEILADFFTTKSDIS
jgi:hypothetical protein